MRPIRADSSCGNVNAVSSGALPAHSDNRRNSLDGSIARLQLDQFASAPYRLSVRLPQQIEKPAAFGAREPLLRRRCRQISDIRLSLVTDRAPTFSRWATLGSRPITFSWGDYRLDARPVRRRFETSPAFSMNSTAD